MDKNTSILAFLRGGQWFAALPAPLQVQIVERSIVRSYRKGALIILEGEPAKGMHAVLEGRVHGTRTIRDGAEALIHVGDAGSWFGDYAVLAGSHSIGGVRADTAVRTLFLSVAAFERIVDEEPRYYRCFARLALERFALLFRYYAEAKGLPAEEWLRTRLEDLAAMRRRDMPMAGPVEIGVSQSELASMVGVTRQTLSALLARLQARGLIEVGFRKIRVLG